MKIKSCLLILFVIICGLPYAQTSLKPVARFTFNDKSDLDDVNKRHAKLVGSYFATDRFGNENNAVGVSGDKYSYINLGTDNILKPKAGTISMWLKIDNVVFAGKGYSANPILLTKSSASDDFYEGYAIYYNFMTGKIETGISKDSTRQACVRSVNRFERYTWHHAVLCYDRNFCSFYLDGVLQRKAVKNFESRFLEGDSVLIGSTGNKVNERFTDGSFDDIQFYDRVLNDQEVLELYHAPNPNRNKIYLNWALLAVAFLSLIALIYFFIRYRLNLSMQKERQRLENYNIVLETELRVNRALMNPHFVFNSLNALQNFILKNENDRANHYLVKFSKLMRKILENNMSDSITLEMEIDLMNKYLEIEDLRFEENVMHTIHVDPAIQASSVKIPIMMLQPFIENAIWHGLLKKTGTKALSVSFSLYDSKYIMCVIEDNGLGFKKDTGYNLERKSLGIGFVEQRLRLFNRIHGLDCSLSIENRPNQSGTTVKIILPILK